MKKPYTYPIITVIQLENQALIAAGPSGLGDNDLLYDSNDW